MRPQTWFHRPCGIGMTLFCLLCAQTASSATLWEPGDVLAALNQQDVSLQGRLPRIGAALEDTLLVELAVGGGCVVREKASSSLAVANQEPMDTAPLPSASSLEAFCLQGDALRQKAEMLIRLQQNQFVGWVAHRISGGEEDALSPAEALQRLLGPACPADLCQQATPNPAALREFESVSPGTPLQFGDVLMANNGSWLVSALSSTDAVLFRSRRPPERVRSATLTSDLGGQGIYRLLSARLADEPSFYQALPSDLGILEDLLRGAAVPMSGTSSTAVQHSDKASWAPGTPETPAWPITLHLRLASVSDSVGMGPLALLGFGPLIHSTDWPEWLTVQVQGTIGGSNRAFESSFAPDALQDPDDTRVAYVLGLTGALSAHSFLPGLGYLEFGGGMRAELEGLKPVYGTLDAINLEGILRAGLTPRSKKGRTPLSLTLVGSVGAFIHGPTAEMLPTSGTSPTFESAAFSSSLGLELTYRYVRKP